jgi:hypothetical protein
MSSKRVTAIALAALMAGALLGQPATAGVGGCGNSVKSPVAMKGSAGTVPTADASRWGFAGRVLDVLTAWLRGFDGNAGKHGASRTEGVGGCFSLWGVGGCKL